MISGGGYTSLLSEVVSLCLECDPQSLLLQALYAHCHPPSGGGDESLVELDLVLLQRHVLPILETLLLNSNILCQCTNHACLAATVKALQACGILKALPNTASQATQTPQLQACILKTAAAMDLLQSSDIQTSCKSIIVHYAIEEQQRTWNWDRDLTEAQKLNLAFAQSLVNHTATSQSTLKIPSPTLRGVHHGSSSREFQFPVLASCVIEIARIDKCKVHRKVIEALFEILLGVINDTEEYSTGELLIFNRPIKHPQVFKLITLILTTNVERDVYMWTLSSLTLLLAANPENLELMYSALENDWTEWVTPLLLSSHHQNKIIRSQKEESLRISSNRLVADMSLLDVPPSLHTGPSEDDLQNVPEEDDIVFEVPNSEYIVPNSEDIAVDDEVKLSDARISPRMTPSHEDKSKQMVFSYEILLAVLMTTAMLSKCSSPEKGREMLYRVLDRLDQPAIHSTTGSSGDISRVFLFASLKKLLANIENHTIEVDAVFSSNLMELISVIVDFIFFGTRSLPSFNSTRSIASTSSRGGPFGPLSYVTSSSDPTSGYASSLFSGQSMMSNIVAGSLQSSARVMITLKDDFDDIQIPDVVLTDRLVALLKEIIKIVRLSSMNDANSETLGRSMRNSSLKMKLKTKQSHNAKLQEKLEQVYEFANLAHSFLLMLSDPDNLEANPAKVTLLCLQMGSALYSLQKGKILGTGQRKKIASEESFQDMMNFYVLSVNAMHKQAAVKSKSKESSDLRPLRGETIVKWAHDFVKDQVSRTIGSAPTTPLGQTFGGKRSPLASSLQEEKSHGDAPPILTKSSSAESNVPLSIVRSPVKSGGSLDKPSSLSNVQVAVVDPTFVLPEQTRERSVDISSPPTTTAASLSIKRESSHQHSR